jgi:hypothetical protein
MSLVVCGSIHMSDIPSFPYNIPWDARENTSVDPALDALRAANRVAPPTL